MDMRSPLGISRRLKKKKWQWHASDNDPTQARPRRRTAVFHPALAAVPPEIMPTPWRSAAPEVGSLKKTLREPALVYQI